MTEFFPVSSSGHLALLPHLLELPDPGVAFDLLMHLGTTLAVVIYFRVEVRELWAALWNFVRGRKGHAALPWLKNFFFSTLASLVLIIPLEGVAGDYGRQAPWIAANPYFFLLCSCTELIAGGGGLQGDGVDLRSRQEWGRAVLIGIFQALAIFPGVSRSGVTLTAARLAGPWPPRGHTLFLFTFLTHHFWWPFEGAFGLAGRGAFLFGHLDRPRDRWRGCDHIFCRGDLRHSLLSQVAGEVGNGDICPLSPALGRGNSLFLVVKLRLF